MSPPLPTATPLPQAAERARRRQRIRRLVALALGAALALVLLASVGAGVANYWLRRRAAAEAAGAGSSGLARGQGAASGEAVLLPADLFEKPTVAPVADGGAEGAAAAPADEAGSGGNADGAMAETPGAAGQAGAGSASAAGAVAPALYPAWQAGTARLEQARPISDAADYTAPRFSPLGLDVACTRVERGGLWLLDPGPAAGPVVEMLSLDPTVGRGTAYTWNQDGLSLRLANETAELQTDVLITGERTVAPPPTDQATERDGAIYRVERPEEEALARLAARPEAALAADAGGGVAAAPADGRPRLRARTAAGDEVLLVRISGSFDRFAEPVVSPDQQWVCYRGKESGLFLSRLDGTRTLGLGAGENPQWMPDSKGIVYNTATSDGTRVVDGDLWMATADGATRTNLTATPGILETHPAMAPDGLRVAFVREGGVYVGRLATGPSRP